MWASGNHVWIGNSGTLTAKATAKARKIQRAVFWAISWLVASSTRSKVRPPSTAWALSTTRARIPTSISAEPNMV